jgi:hypothetical protein
MATCFVTVENAYFIECGELVTATHTFNGWDCEVLSDGTILCQASRVYSDGEHSVRYTIKPNGFGKLTRKLPGKKIETLRKGFVVPKGEKPTDGTIGLSGGNIDSRYAFWRGSELTWFMEYFHLTAVKFQNPDGEYVVHNSRYGGGEAKYTINTDGEVETGDIESTNWGYTSSCYKELVHKKISGASWVLVDNDIREGDYISWTRILYTQERSIGKLWGLLWNNQDVRRYVLVRQQVAELDERLNGRLISSTADVEGAIREALSIVPGFEAKADTEKVEAYMAQFPTEKGKHFFLKVWGIMPGDRARLLLEWGDPNGSHSWSEVELASGELGHAKA